MLTLPSSTGRNDKSARKCRSSHSATENGLNLTVTSRQIYVEESHLNIQSAFLINSLLVLAFIKRPLSTLTTLDVRRVAHLRVISPSRLAISRISTI